MRITFFSNFFNSHQLPLAIEFHSFSNVDYTFVSLLSTEGIVGRTSLDDEYDFVLKEYEDEASADLAMRHAVEDDIVVFGDMAGKERYVRARAKTGKPFFRYAERLLKRGDWWRFVPFKAYRTWDWFGRYKNCEMCVLCASAYTARDLGLFGFPASKCLKWGYFPQVKSGPSMVVSNTQLPRYKALCSAQRLIPWKRADLQIRALQRVISAGVDTRLAIAGDGPEREKLEKLAVELGVTESVDFLGELSHDSVLSLMRENGIFLATSDRHEGWGATINEAMSMGCCVIACEEMGAVPYLVEKELNGFSFSGADTDELADCILKALSDDDHARQLGEAARKTMSTEWSAQEAVSRFVRFSEEVCLTGFEALVSDEYYSCGPLSPAVG